MSNRTQSVGTSPCGTFAVVGSAGGAIDTYNLQSGQHRRRFPVRMTQAEANALKLQQMEDLSAVANLGAPSGPKFKKGQGKHKGAITGIAVDSLNRVLVSSGEDGKVKVCAFYPHLNMCSFSDCLSSGTSTLACFYTRSIGIQ